MKYLITNEAFQDLNAIWKYTEETWSNKQANIYYNLVIETIEFLCNNPKKGKPINEIRIGYRKMKVKSHLIIYKINEDILLISRILHEKMDFNSILK